VNIARVHHWIGRELILAKEDVDHGQWLPWLREKFGWDERTAQRYVGVAKVFKSDSVSDLRTLTIDASALYLLSARTS
jgi:hypothetical protein